MRPGARIKAAIEVLEDIATTHRPAATALADWGKTHRFAGSGDRSAIGSLVFDALRRRNSISWRMGTDSPRALALGASLTAFGATVEQLETFGDGSGHSFEPLSSDETAGLNRAVSPDAALWIRGDIPEWAAARFGALFGQRAGEEAAALAERAPIDLRANGLKATREKVEKAFQKYGAAATPWSPVGVRIPPPEGLKKAPNVEADAAHGKGWFEVQDEGSQLAALIAGAEPRQQVIDLCAGAGGKTLALAAQMRNTGQIFAYDESRQQLRPIFERLKRAGVRNAQVMEAGDIGALGGLAGRFDLVFADAPCSGSGTWRRRPDAKWRLKPEALAARIEEQRAVLKLAAPLVRPGGRVAYVTCSVLPEENDAQVAWFLKENPEFVGLEWQSCWQAAIGSAPPVSAIGGDTTLLLTPHSHGTDGFFIALFERRGS